MLKISFSTFFLSMVWLLHTQNFMFTRPALHVFCKKTSQIFDKIDQTKYSFKSIESFASFKKRTSIFRSKLNMKLCFTFLNFWFFYFHCLTHSAMTHWLTGVTARRYYCIWRVEKYPGQECLRVNDQLLMLSCSERKYIDYIISNLIMKIPTYEVHSILEAIMDDEGVNW